MSAVQACDTDQGYAFTARSLKSVSLHDCSVEWAAQVLNDYGLDDWDWLVHDLAETMDDAALSAVDDWLRDYRGQIEHACQWPRWCPCGRWPDFGTNCPYHGRCTCIATRRDDFSVDAKPTIVSIIRWNGHDRYIGPGCPVHPEGWMPADARDAYEAAKGGRGWAFTTTIFGPRGRMDSQLGSSGKDGA